jgi:predicted RND superfamily exporter protein
LLAIRKTLQTTGSALFTTSVVLTLSFGVFMLGSMQGIQLFGLLAAFGAAIALVADLVLAPALVVMAKRQRPVPVAGREPQALGPATR